MIKVVNVYKVKSNIYCGRGSALGNPFVMHNEAQRNEVCDKYEEYFNNKVKVLKDEKMLNELRIIYKEAIKGDVNLGCYCAPKRCHCDTIKSFIENAISNKK